MAVSLEDRRASGGQAVSSWISISRIALYAGFALAVFLAVGSLTWPLSDDHLHYAYVGDTIMDGGVPYRDAWELKGPLTYYLYGWVRALLGRNEISIREFDLVAVALFCWRLRLLVLRLNGQHVFGANFSVLFFLLCYFGAGYYWAAQPDDWGAILTLVAVSFLLDRNHSPYFNVSAAAVAIALSALLKPTFVIFVSLMLLPTDRSTILAPDNLRRFFLGLLVVAFIITTSYLWVFRNGGFQDLIDALRFVLSAYGTLPERSSLPRISWGVRNLYNIGLVVPYVLVPIGLWAIYRSGQRMQARMLGVWFSLGIFMLWYQGMYHQYEYISATVAAIVIFSVSVTLFRQRVKAPLGKPLTDGALLLMIGTMCLAPAISFTVFGALAWPSYVFGLRSLENYQVKISHPWDRRDAIVALSKYLSTHTTHEDKVQIWGWAGGLGALMLSDRKSATRFDDTWSVSTVTPLKSYYRGIFMQEISQSRPRCIIVDVSSIWLIERVRQFPEFEQFLNRNYKLSARIESFEIWTLTPS